jgi:F0F1-type ATP synthase assembly protein I
VPDDRSGGGRGSLGEALKYAQVGTMLVAPILAFGAIGYWLDGRLGTKPWLLLAGLIFGMIGGFVSFFRLVLPPKGPGAAEGGK